MALVRMARQAKHSLMARILLPPRWSVKMERMPLTRQVEQEVWPLIQPVIPQPMVAQEEMEIPGVLGVDQEAAVVQPAHLEREKLGGQLQLVVIITKQAAG